MKSDWNRRLLGIALLALLATGRRAGPVHAQSASAPPTPDHVVIVIEENKSYAQIIGSPSAPYINSLATAGANFTSSHGVTHPSQPNYIAFFSGSTQGVTNDTTPPAGSPYSAANLASELIAAGKTFGGYSEDLPYTGFTGSSSGNYVRKHNPWVDFSNVPSTANMPFTNFMSITDYATLPTVCIVVPNMINDMHDGSISQGDTWLQTHLDAYKTWAATHNSLLIVTWDEDDFTTVNQIPTIFVGPMVAAGSYSETIKHYNVLRTIEDMYGLPHAGASATAAAILDCWTSGGSGGGGGGGTDTGTTRASGTGDSGRQPSWFNRHCQGSVAAVDLESNGFLLAALLSALVLGVVRRRTRPLTLV